MSMKIARLNTRLVHAGEPRPGIEGAVVLPVFQSSTYEFTGAESYHDIKYMRLNNTPNHIALQKKLAAVESAEAALVTASGMAAISTSLLTILSSGDHFLAQSSLYGGTHDLLVKDLGSYGISFDFIDADDADSWKQHLRSNTKAIYVETITNPTIEVGDLKGIAEFAKAHGLISMIDNTFASPVNFRPIEHGFDLSLHSCTKYINGHTDIVAGAVIGGSELVTRIKHKLDHLGGSLDTHACFLLHRGMKTLALRVRRQNESAQALAEFLEKHPSVEKVNYPGLKSNHSFQYAVDLLDGCGGMLSFELRGGLEAAERFTKRLTIPIIAPSLGGVETLVTIPATTSHSGLAPEERQRVGVSDGLIRVSVGIEDADDLLEDFQQAQT